MTGARDDELLRWDETLLEGEDPSAPDGLPEDEQLRTELLRQRLVHGLLVAAHEPDREAARERRVQAIVSALPAARASGRVVRMRPWLSLAAALMVAAIIALVFASRGDAPRLEAMIDDAVRELRQDVDRRIRLTIDEVQPDGELLVCGTHELTVRPGHFLVRVDGTRTGKWEIGSNGEQLWRRSLDPVGEVQLGALSDQRQMLSDLFGESLLGLGYLDLARVLASVPDGLPIRSEGRRTVKPGGPELEVILVEGGFPLFGGEASGLIVHIDPVTDEVFRISFRVDGPTVKPDGAFVLTYKLEGILSVQFGGAHLYDPPK